MAAVALVIFERFTALLLALRRNGSPSCRMSHSRGNGDCEEAGSGRLVRIIFLRPDSSSDQIDLHLTEFQRTARARSPFRLAIVGKVVAPVICRLGILACSLQ